MKPDAASTPRNRSRNHYGRCLIGTFAALAVLLTTVGAADDYEWKKDGLRIRLVSDSGRSADGTLLATVGTPCEFGFTVENVSDRMLAVSKPGPARAEIFYFPPGSTICATPSDAPPGIWRLVELAPGQSMAFESTFVPSLSGQSRVALTIANQFDYAIRDDLRGHDGRLRERKVPREDLWRGVIRIELPIRVVLPKTPRFVWSGRETQRDKLESGDLTPIEAVGNICSLIDNVRNERLVTILDRRIDSTTSALERGACFAGLGVAVQRGYGWNAIPRILQRATQEGAGEDERALAVEVAALLTGKDIRHTSRNRLIHYRFRVPDALRSDALSLLRSASKEHGVIGTRARAILPEFERRTPE